MRRLNDNTHKEYLPVIERNCEIESISDATLLIALSDIQQDNPDSGLTPLPNGPAFLLDLGLTFEEIKGSMLSLENSGKCIFKKVGNLVHFKVLNEN